ncbi:MAG: Mur ligase family protein, partial [Candidatus Dormibacteraceae bacterium]
MRLPTKTISQLAAGVPGATVLRGGEYKVRRVMQDSRQATAGDLFVARRGLRRDGHDFAAEVAERGAAVAGERELPLPPNTPIIQVEDGDCGLAELAAEFYDRPARQMLIAGVTGTDGKTTVTHLAAHLLNSAGFPTGFLSTAANDSGDGACYNHSGQSTMESPDVQRALAEMLANGRRAVVIEATSHALSQSRVAACDFDVAAYT